MGWGMKDLPLADGADTPGKEELDRIREVASVALSDGLLNVEEIARMEEILAHNYDMMQRIERAEQAACSDPRSFSQPDGTQWSYVVVSDEFVRITGCDTSAVTLEIPASIEGMPVAELGVDACARLDSVRKIICSPQIERVGKCAFRNCPNLETLVLPQATGEYDASWARGCKRLSSLALPGLLARVTQDIFEAGDLRHLAIGVGTYEFAPGAFANSKLESIEVDAQNPAITTDGKAIFAHDGANLRVLALPCTSYVVPDGCQVIEKKAFANRGELASVKLPATLTAIEDYAFSYSGLTRFDAPASLRSIGDHAFFRCRKLQDVTLNEGLVIIGDDAFSGTGITRLVAPSTLEVLGHHIAANTQLTFTGTNAGFTIVPGGILSLDAQGGLYRRASDGLHFVRMLDHDVTRYAVAAGTVEIEPLAFAHLSELQRVDFPQGLLRIGDAAFRDCHNLAIADFPPTLQSVGDEAFLDTSLARVHAPASLTHIGSIALITHGARNADVAPALTSIEVDPANERFYAAPGLLIERHPGAGSHVVAYAEGTPSVRIPDDVTVIDSYAFGGARHLRELYLSDRIRKINIRSLSLDCMVEHIHVDLDNPIEGRDSFDFYFPDAPRSAHEIQLAFNLSASVDLARLFKHYDSAIANMHEFDQQTSGVRDDFDAYGQAKLAIDRLIDPVLMSSTSRAMLTQLLTKELGRVCEAIARHDDRKAIDDLLELGILNKDNLLDIIERTSKLQDAAMTGYLLEVKRRLFSRSAIDFEL